MEEEWIIPCRINGRRNPAIALFNFNGGYKNYPRNLINFMTPIKYQKGERNTSLD